MHALTPLALAALALTATALPSPGGGNSNGGHGHGHKKTIGVQGHRGGLGMRSEESLWAYAYSMEIGVNTLEMDTVFTKDGVPVIWHDHKILATKCRGEHVNKFIANLTLAEVKTLDCSVQLTAHNQQELHPLTRIATLEEVLDLVNCYGNKEVTINLETKLDPLNPAETLPVENYINDLVPILKKKGFFDRTTIQSFDWRTIVGIKEKWPRMKTVALIDGSTTAVKSADGSYPWLNNIKLDAAPLNGDWVRAAALTKASILSPVHGTPSSATPNTPGYVPFVTKEVVDRAHKLGMDVIPWTVDYEVTIRKLIGDGVDAIISDYPERVMWIAREMGYDVGTKPSKSKAQCLAKA